MFRFNRSCTESWYVVITDDSSRDLVNELIHHSFISEVRLKHTDPHYILQISYFQYVHHLKAHHLLHVTWNHIGSKQLQLNVHFLFNFLSYAHILPSISTGGWWQDRSIPGGSFEPTPWVCWSHNNHLNDYGHLHASETWEGGLPNAGRRTMETNDTVCQLVWIIEIVVKKDRTWRTGFMTTYDWAG